MSLGKLLNLHEPQDHSMMKLTVFQCTQQVLNNGSFPFIPLTFPYVFAFSTYLLSPIKLQLFLVSSITNLYLLSNAQYFHYSSLQWYLYGVFSLLPQSLLLICFTGIFICFIVKVAGNEFKTIQNGFHCLLRSLISVLLLAPKKVIFFFFRLHARYCSLSFDFLILTVQVWFYLYPCLGKT